jgi:hypothetical protein
MPWRASIECPAELRPAATLRLAAGTLPALASAARCQTGSGLSSLTHSLSVSGQGQQCRSEREFSVPFSAGLGSEWAGPAGARRSDLRLDFVLSPCLSGHGQAPDAELLRLQFCCCLPLLPRPAHTNTQGSWLPVTAALATPARPVRFYLSLHSSFPLHLLWLSSGHRVTRKRGSPSLHSASCS